MDAAHDCAHRREGRLRLSGFRGTYRITAAEHSAEMKLDAAANQAEASVALPR
ncbi:hypothetical protein [Actinomyces ruminis]|uniref:hypothetical protein n=1 Tax=Actinomyces ruminis TaxID=1937003 RepID=UPI001C559082|nr:hypothetical protein [Actinomyces ruminis]